MYRERLCGLIPSPACSLCNYQLDFISQEDNNSLPQCVVEGPDPAAVREQRLTSILLLQCDTQRKGEMSSSCVIKHVVCVLSLHTVKSKHDAAF